MDNASSSANAARGHRSNSSHQWAQQKFNNESIVMVGNACNDLIT